MHTNVHRLRECSFLNVKTACPFSFHACQRQNYHHFRKIAFIVNLHPPSNVNKFVSFSWVHFKYSDCSSNVNDTVHFSGLFLHKILFLFPLKFHISAIPFNRCIIFFWVNNIQHTLTPSSTHIFSYFFLFSVTISIWCIHYQTGYFVCDIHIWMCPGIYLCVFREGP